jgi:Tol biopolymer transport system component
MRVSAGVGAVLLLALPRLAPPAFAQSAESGKHPVTHEALWMMKRVGAPVVSPDGRWVVFSVTEPAYDEKKEVSDLWIVSTDGTGIPRRLTSTRAAESGPAWSPDSRFLAFATKREDDEVAQMRAV